MPEASRRFRLCLAVLFAAALTSVSTAQGETELPLGLDALYPDLEGLEQEAWLKLQSGAQIEARELAEQWLGKHPQSFAAHFVVAFVLHYAEADFPKARFHAERALDAFEARHGKTPEPTTPWRWHARILRELASITGDLEKHEDRLRYIARFNKLYEPDLVAEQAWTLMKLRRLPEARMAASQGLASGDPMQKEIALNALCAIEFEAGNDVASYDACRRAVEFGENELGTVSAVDLTNAAEAARSLFRLEEAEQLLMRATDVSGSWYGNPWLELSDLYLREARFADALSALTRIPPYRAQRPPHVRNADQAEHWRMLGAFLTVSGYPKQALAFAERANAYPDRRGHNSRDPAQDRIVSELLYREALRGAAQAAQEAQAAAPWYRRLWAWGKAQVLDLRGWLAGRRAAKLLLEEQRLVRLLRIGTAGSAITPPWLVGSLTELIGAEALQTAIERAAEQDKRPSADAYYAAFAADVSGDPQQAAAALAKLPSEERLLRARMHAIIARARGDVSAWRAMLALDPSLPRRARTTLPVRTQAGNAQVAREALAALGRSPRFDENPAAPLVLTANGNDPLVLCLGVGGERAYCHEAKRGKDDDAFVKDAVANFQAELFGARLGLDDAAIQGLDATGTRATTAAPMELLEQGVQRGTPD